MCARTLVALLTMSPSIRMNAQEKAQKGRERSVAAGCHCLQRPQHFMLTLDSTISVSFDISFNKMSIKWNGLFPIHCSHLFCRFVRAHLFACLLFSLAVLCYTFVSISAKHFDTFCARCSRCSYVRTHSLSVNTNNKNKSPLSMQFSFVSLLLLVMLFSP